MLDSRPSPCFHSLREALSEHRTLPLVLGEVLCCSHGNCPLTNQASHLSGSLAPLPGDGPFPLTSCGVNSPLLSSPLELCLLRCCAAFPCDQCPCPRDPRASLTHSRESWRTVQCGTPSDTLDQVQHHSHLLQFLLC